MPPAAWLQTTPSNISTCASDRKMWLKALIATTCLAILIALSWLGWREYKLAEERNARKEMVDCINKQMQSIDGMTAELAGLQCAFILASE